MTTPISRIDKNKIVLTRPYFVSPSEIVYEIKQAMIQFLGQNRHLSFQDIENDLRHGRTRIYLFAKELQNGDIAEWPPGTRQSYEINIHISFDGEIQFDAGSYEANYQRLRECGYVLNSKTSPRTCHILRQNGECCPKA